ncbi:hypothetical protein V1477_010476 [Vespula maculifrons]|uniref:Uncharacterized protein n=1 Tax=Vespula maculifrons TaxID=7453 RepID=A0ABD2C9B3_VESMC
MAAFATTVQYRYLPLKCITSKSEGYESVIDAFKLIRLKRDGGRHVNDRFCCQIAVNHRVKYLCQTMD